MDSMENHKENWSAITIQVGWPAFKRARRLKAPPTQKKKKIFLQSSSSSSAASSRIVNSNDFLCDNKMSKSSGQSRKMPANKLLAAKFRWRRWPNSLSLRSFAFALLLIELVSDPQFSSIKQQQQQQLGLQRSFIGTVGASLIIGDSAIEIQEVDQSSSASAQQNELPQKDVAEAQQPQQQEQQSDLGVILGSSNNNLQQQQQQQQDEARPHHELSMVTPGIELHANQQVSSSSGTESVSRSPSGPLPPLVKPGAEDITDGDHKSRNNHDYDLSELRSREDEKEALREALHPDKTITGTVVDFELQSAGGHNKAKIKKKKKKKMMEKKEAAFKKWGSKKKMEKKAMEKEEKKHMKKKKEESKKKKKKWGHEVHGQKKKGNFKKKKWGKKIKKGKGVKKGKKGKKFLKDKGHKNTGFKNVYHKEEWGDSKKWHDIKREKKWDEKSKKWKKKWNKVKGKKYKGDHMKKFEKNKKEGKKYKKDKKEKYKKFKKEMYEQGKKKKMEEHKKKKEGGAKKEEKELMKKKKKKKP